MIDGCIKPVPVILGRTQKNLDECAAEIKSRGGVPIPVQMDHGIDSGKQCCGSGMFIPDPDPGSDLSCHPGSYIKK
jgi:hypothetical protein